MVRKTWEDDLVRTVGAVAAVTGSGECERIEMPMTLRKWGNERGRWQSQAGTKKLNRQGAEMAVKASRRLAELRSLAARGELAVAIVRRSNRLLDSDGVASACKHVRDGIADALGVNDGSDNVVWLTAQERASVASCLIVFARIES